MILLHRKVFPRPGRPTRMMISFCLSTLFLFRTFPGPRLLDTRKRVIHVNGCKNEKDSLADGIRACYGLRVRRRGGVDSA